MIPTALIASTRLILVLLKLLQVVVTVIKNKKILTVIVIHSVMKMRMRMKMFNKILIRGKRVLVSKNTM